MLPTKMFPLAEPLLLRANIFSSIAGVISNDP